MHAMLLLLAGCSFAAILLYLLLSLGGYSLSANGSPFAFALINSYKVLPPYADMRWLTSLSECDVDLKLLAAGRLWGCDPYGRGGGLGYPPLSVEMARNLGIKGAHTELLSVVTGLAAIAILCVLVFCLIKPLVLRYVVGSLILIGFPVQLALERGNVDVILFLVLAALTGLLAFGTYRLLPFVAGLSWFMVAVKLYPLAGFMLWAAVSWNQLHRFRVALLAVLGGGLLGLLSALEWLRVSARSIPKARIGPASHGLAVDFSWLQSLPRALGSPEFLDVMTGLVIPGVLGLMIFVASIVLGRTLGLNRYFKAAFDDLPSRFERHFLSLYTSLGALIWLSCYVLTISFDYRMIFAMPSFVLLFRFSAERFLEGERRLLMACLFAALAVVLLSPLGVYSLKMPVVVSSASMWLCSVSDQLILPAVAGLLVCACLPLRAQES